MKKATPKKQTWSGKYPRLSIAAGIALIILGIAVSDSDLLNSSGSIASNDYANEEYWEEDEALDYIDEVKNWDRSTYENIQVATTNVEYDEDDETSIETYSHGDSYEELVEAVGPPTRTFTNKGDATRPSIVDADWEKDLEDGGYISINIRYEKDTGQIISKDCYGSF
ncbi:hypothetical protein [Candidatus Enterococcus ferrettii]|uniref:Uncharacterized protein n=1 Tax=Candidatus Enterococcus ferrettii TaxID=2815324 RepID=A0ABV0EHW9_9ENTE|nr:hypothetical protein [Enterococcus sp. 665A]MBO1339577.1 hypothetical protein [Enterococcus sp. 665A]